MARIHFIAMAGLHGCMPNYCEVFGDYRGAVDSLVELHELGKRRARELRKDGCIELNLNRDGNEYAEVSDCDCASPGDHSDEGESPFDD